MCQTMPHCQGPLNDQRVLTILREVCIRQLASCQKITYQAEARSQRNEVRPLMNHAVFSDDIGPIPKSLKLKTCVVLRSESNGIQCQSLGVPDNCLDACKNRPNRGSNFCGARFPLGLGICRLYVSSDNSDQASKVLSFSHGVPSLDTWMCSCSLMRRHPLQVAGRMHWGFSWYHGPAHSSFRAVEPPDAHGRTAASSPRSRDRLQPCCRHQ